MLTKWLMLYIRSNQRGSTSLWSVRTGIPLRIVHVLDVQMCPLGGVCAWIVIIYSLCFSAGNSVFNSLQFTPWLDHSETPKVKGLRTHQRTKTVNEDKKEADTMQNPMEKSSEGTNGRDPFFPSIHKLILCALTWSHGHIQNKQQCHHQTGYLAADIIIGNGTKAIPQKIGGVMKVVHSTPYIFPQNTIISKRKWLTIKYVPFLLKPGP